MTQLMFSWHGIFSIYKPLGVTSHDVVDQVRKITGEKRVGHAGTLDPLATGVLIVAVGREYTKQLDQLMLQEKEYVAQITLGQTSTTDDAEGEKTSVSVDDIPTDQQVHAVLMAWVGQVDQVPPIYSAIKIQGKPAHRRVRQGQEISLSSRTVVIHEIKLLDYHWPQLKIKVICAKGVYIRSLARDIGKDLGTGAYLSGLERTRVGTFTIDQAIHL